MFEATLSEGGVLKKIFEAIKELVENANFDCQASGISLQAMDSSHVSLVHMMLKSEGFTKYRCDRPVTLGIPMTSMSKILKCAGNDDSITIRANDDPDKVTFVFVSKEQDRVSDFELKLIEIDGDMLGIPETKYKATVKLSASEFQRICKDMTQLGDTMTIAVTKEGVKFSVSGEIGTGNITLAQSSSVDKDDSDSAVVIELQEPVQLTFALRFLSSFTKATSLSSSVSLSLTKDSPLIVEYKIEDFGYIRYFLAPKIDDNEETEEAKAQEEKEEN